MVEGEPFGRGEVGSGFSGRAWGGSHGARPGQDARGPSLPNTRDKSQMACFNCALQVRMSKAHSQNG